MTGRRHGENPRLRNSQRARLGRAHPRRENLARLAVPGGRVDDRLPVGSKARSGQITAAKRQRRALRPRRFPFAPGLDPLAGKERQDGDAGRGQNRRREGEAGEAPPPRSRRLDPSSRNPRGMIAQRCQVACQVLRRPVPILGILRETPLDHPPQARRGLRRRRRYRLRLRLDDRRESLCRSRTLERAPARHQLVEDRSEGELIRPEIRRLPARLLRRHVPDRAQNRSRLGSPRHRGEIRSARALEAGALELGQAEVEDLDEPVPRHHHVLGLQVPVHDPGGVRLGEPVGRLRRDGEQPLQRQGARPDELTESLSLHELHRDERGPVRLPDLVDRHDVGVIQRRRGPRFLLEARQALDVLRELRRKHLDRDVPRELRVSGPVDLAHAAGADRANDFVGGQPRAGGKRHRGGRSFMVERVEPVRFKTRSVRIAGPTLTTSRSARVAEPRIFLPPT